MSPIDRAEMERDIALLADPGLTLALVADEKRGKWMVALVRQRLHPNDRPR